jgi:hypothetical protein
VAAHASAFLAFNGHATHAQIVAADPELLMKISPLLWKIKDNITTKLLL